MPSSIKPTSTIQQKKSEVRFENIFLSPSSNCLDDSHSNVMLFGRTPATDVVGSVGDNPDRLRVLLTGTADPEMSWPRWATGGAVYNSMKCFWWILVHKRLHGPAFCCIWLLVWTLCLKKTWTFYLMSGSTAYGQVILQWGFKSISDPWWREGEGGCLDWRQAVKWNKRTPTSSRHYLHLCFGSISFLIFPFLVFEHCSGLHTRAKAFSLHHRIDVNRSST